MISRRFIQQSEERVSLIPHALRMCLNKENITRDLSGKFPSKQEDDLRKWESRVEISTSAAEWSRWCAGGERQQAAARSCMETVPAYGFYLLGPHKFWFLFLKQYTLSQFIWVPFICPLFTWPHLDGDSCSDPRTKWLKDAKFTLYIALHFAEVLVE